MIAILITVVHVIACFFLIVVVLLQTGKGADIGAVFGGSSQTIFGSSGAGNLLTKLTTGTAITFMLTSIFLTWNSTRHITRSIADTIPQEPPPLSAPAKAGEDGGEPAAAGDSDQGKVGEAAPAGDAAATGQAATGQAEARQAVAAPEEGAAARPAEPAGEPANPAPANP